MIAPVMQDATTALRRAIYGILIAVAVGNMAGRILAVNSVDVSKLEKHRIDQRLKETRQELTDRGIEGEALEARLNERRKELAEKLRMQRPFLSSNDRSRWATVRSLIELGTYEIDTIVAEPNWDTIDMVAHRGRDGEKHLYSSKPPLLATFLAGEYWVIHKISGGKTLGTHPYEIGRLMLLSFNIPLFVVTLLLLARLVERFGQTDFGRIFVMATAAIGTLLSSFTIVLNNHLFAAASMTIAVFAAVRIVAPSAEGHTPEREGLGRYFFLAGLAGAFTVACELPALSLLALLSAVLLWTSPRQTLLWFTPAVLLVAAAFFGTNYAAHETLSPPYAHRHAENPDDNWYHYTFIRNGRERDSYWKDPHGIDRGEPDRRVYALHVLVGHHGILSLTPVWLLSVLGMGIWIVERKYSRKPTAGSGQLDRDSNPISRIRNPEFILALSTALLTIVCLVFFIVLRPQEDRNYGGMTNGFRWLFWLAPLWLVTMLPAADWAGHRRWSRCLAATLLALSVLSAAYATWNPWSHPWIARFLEYLGWIRFG